MEGRSKKLHELPTAESAVAVNAIQNDGGLASRVYTSARIKMSRLGRTRNPHFADKEGKVVGSGRLNSGFRILFDGRKTPITLHRDYIEPSEEGSD